MVYNWALTFVQTNVFQNRNASPKIISPHSARQQFNILSTDLININEFFYVLGALGWIQIAATTINFVKMLINK